MIFRPILGYSKASSLFVSFCLDSWHKTLVFLRVNSKTLLIENGSQTLRNYYSGSCFTILKSSPFEFIGVSSSMWCWSLNNWKVKGMMHSVGGRSLSLKEGQCLPVKYEGDFTYDHNKGQNIVWMSLFHLHIRSSDLLKRGTQLQLECILNDKPQDFQLGREKKAVISLIWNALIEIGSFSSLW